MACVPWFHAGYLQAAVIAGTCEITSRPAWEKAQMQ